MNRVRLVAGCALSVSLLAGCNAGLPPAEVGSAGEVVVRSMDAIGGQDAWRKVVQVRADAVLRVYGPDGSEYVSPQTQRIDMWSGELRAAADVPDGQWTATARALDGVSMSAQGSGLSPSTRELLGEALGMLAHRVRGPINLLHGPEIPRSRETVWVQGRPLERVRVGGDTRQALAYYFDADSGLLEMVTSGADEAGGDGTVALYEYAAVKGGYRFPRQIRIVRIGRNVLVGVIPVAVVEYSNVVVE